MEVTVTCQSIIRTCTRGIFRYSFLIFPEPDEKFTRYLAENRNAAVYSIGPSTFFRVDISETCSIKGMTGDPILVATTDLPEKEIGNTIVSLFTGYQAE